MELIGVAKNFRPLRSWMHPFWVVFTMHPRRASAHQGTSLDFFFFSSKLMLFASYSNMAKPHSVSLSEGVSGVQCNPSAPLS